jgi:predicted transposase YbfD/YdcC
VVSGNDYVIQVKSNQKNLKAAIVAKSENEKADQIHISDEKNRGRIERRETRIYRNVREAEFKKWTGLRDVIVVKRSGIRDGKEYENWHYYISSKTRLSAEIYAQEVRKHWYIENKLHWVKDVIMYEDTCRIRDQSNAANQSMIRNMIINLYRLNGYQSLKKAIEKYTNKITECLNILNNNKYEFN